MRKFIKYYPGISYLFTPVESRFLLHMSDYEFQRGLGYCLDWSKAEYARRMDITEYAFDRCVERFISLGLLTRNYNETGNRVFYRMDLTAYDKLVRIASATRDIDRLKRFYREVFITGGRTLSQVGNEEIKKLEDGVATPKK